MTIELRYCPKKKKIGDFDKKFISWNILKSTTRMKIIPSEKLT